MFQNLRSDNSALPVSILCLLMLLAFGGLVLQTGCNPEADAVSFSHPRYTNVDRDSAEAPRITIGAFNIRSFGRAKMSKPGVVSILVDVARRFDILAIQELREKDQTVVPEFLDLINADGSRYAAAVGPRQGYDISGNRYFEQTVFVYDTTKAELITETYAASNLRDMNNDQVMQRPPFVGHFRTVEVDPAEAFKFVLMNVHVSQKRPHLEFEALQEIIGRIFANHPEEDDFILLGDLNDEPSRYQKYAWMSDQFAAIANHWTTNLAQTKNYDNIIFDAARTSEFLQVSGVLDLMDEYDLTRDEAKSVSDHLPVWATFSAFEAPTATITRDEQGVLR